MVLAASGVDHQDLLEIAEPLLHDLHARPMLEVPASFYVGGELRHRADSEVINVPINLFPLLQRCMICFYCKNTFHMQ
jgi:mitochondrial-processing peptidase subunit alpha